MKSDESKYLLLATGILLMGLGVYYLTRPGLGCQLAGLIQVGIGVLFMVGSQD